MKCGTRSVLRHVDCTEPMGHQGAHRFDDGVGDILEWIGVGQEGDPWRLNEPNSSDPRALSTSFGNEL